MLNFLSLAAATSPERNNSNATMIVLMGIAVAVIAAVILCFKKGKAKPGQVEDEKFYLREIRNYVRIIAVIMIAWVVISIISWVLAIMG